MVNLFCNYRSVGKQYNNIFFIFAYLCCLCSECFHYGVITVCERSFLTTLIQIKLSALHMYTHTLFMYNLNSLEGFFFFKTRENAYYLFLILN